MGYSALTFTEHSFKKTPKCTKIVQAEEIFVWKAKIE